MTRRRRALVLAGLALLLGGLAAADVARRERALRDRLGPTTQVLSVRRALPAGTVLAAGQLAVRQVPSRYAPPGSYAAPGEVTGRRLAVDVPARADVVVALLDDGTGDAADGAGAVGAPVRPGERVAQLVAGGDPGLVLPGSRVDVLITRTSGDGRGASELALEDAEVLAATAVGAEEGGASRTTAGPRVSVSLRTTLRQAMALAAAQDLGRQIRLLPRAASDRRHGEAGLRVAG